MTLLLISEQGDLPLAPTDTSVLILKNFKPQKEVKTAYGFSMTNDKEFIEIQNPLVTLPDTTYQYGFNGVLDTIIVKHTNEVMMAEISFSPLISNSYLLRIGDTLLVDFTNYEDQIDEYYLNTKHYSGDIQKTTILSISDWIELSGFDFLVKGFKKKGLIEKRKEDLFARYRKLDTLKANNNIDPLFADIRKAKIHYELIDINESLEETKYTGLREYKTYLIRKSRNMFFNPKISNSIKDGFENVILFDSVSASSAFNSTSQCYLMYHYLVNIPDDIVFREKYEYFIKQDCPAEFKNRIETSFPERLDEKVDTEESIFLADSLNNETTLEKVLYKNKGSVIYIDFWASWCAPCLRAMPYSHQLREQYKDVIFIYLALNDRERPWKEMMKRQNIVENSYLIVNPKRSKFISNHNINAVPRYMIYDKNGRLVNSNAPSPESPMIKEVLDELLRK